MADECRVGLHTLTRRCWGLRGQRVVVPKQQRYQWESVYGAGFHPTRQAASLPARIHLLGLPPYSPELNPVEGLWDQIKDGVCNRVFPTLEDLEAGLTEALRPFWEDQKRARSLVFGWMHDQANAS